MGGQGVSFSGSSNRSNVGSDETNSSVVVTVVAAHLPQSIWWKHNTFLLAGSTQLSMAVVAVAAAPSCHKSLMQAEIMVGCKHH
jgi:hypothetical protein